MNADRVSLIIYGFELNNALLLIRTPNSPDPVYGLAGLLLAVYGIGLVRAWQLLGVHRHGLLDWLSPLRDVPARAPISNTKQSEAKVNASQKDGEPK